MLDTGEWLASSSLYGHQLFNEEAAITIQTGAPLGTWVLILPRNLKQSYQPTDSGAYII